MKTNVTKKILDEKSKSFLQYFLLVILISFIIISNPINFNFIVFGISIILVFIIAQVCHEYGHYFAHCANKRNPVIKYNRLKLPIQVSAYDTTERPFTINELFFVSVCGIIAGVIPIDIYFYLTHNFIGFMILQIFYIYASRFDIMDIKNYFISYLYFKVHRTDRL
jgi:hypothetical protein